MQVSARQAGNEARKPPASRRAGPAFLPLRSLRDGRWRGVQLRADNAHGVDEAQHNGERSPRIHANLNRHQRDIRREQGEEAEQHAHLPAAVAPNVREPQRCQRNGARYREQAVYRDVLPEHQVEHMQRPVNKHGMHVAGTVVPDVGEAVVGNAHGIAFVEPNVAVEGVRQQKQAAHHQQHDMEARVGQHSAQARECAGMRAPGVGLGMACGGAVTGAFAHARPLCARDENFMVVCLRLKSRRCAHRSLASYPQARISCAEKPASHSNCLHIGWSMAVFCNAPDCENLRERYAFPQVVAGGSAMRARGRHPNV